MTRRLEELRGWGFGKLKGRSAELKGAQGSLKGARGSFKADLHYTTFV